MKDAKEEESIVPTMLFDSQEQQRRAHTVSPLLLPTRPRQGMRILMNTIEERGRYSLPCSRNLNKDALHFGSIDNVSFFNSLKQDSKKKT